MPRIAIPLQVELPSPETVDLDALAASLSAGRTDLVCVLGPTASGKTRYAVNLARELESRCGMPCEIISADSRQVYRGMDIGTGKDLADYGSVPYHLIDILPAGAKYNVWQYQQDFERAWRDIRSRGKVAILCGGTGLYIEAATCGYALTDIPADEKLRAELELLDTQTLVRMVNEERTAALQVNPNIPEEAADSRQRKIRAIEKYRYEATHEVTRTATLPKSTFYIGTLVSREERNRRIDLRLRSRLEEGMVDEIKGLLSGGISPEDLLYYGLEYKFVTQYVLGIISYDDMFTLLSTAIHQFAKRQMTWFRGMERKGIAIHWVEATD